MGDKCLAPPNKWKLHYARLEHPPPPPFGQPHLGESYIAGIAAENTAPVWLKETDEPCWFPAISVQMASSYGLETLRDCLKGPDKKKNLLPAPLRRDEHKDSRHTKLMLYNKMITNH